MTPAGPGNRLLPLDGGSLTGDRGVSGIVSGDDVFEAECLCIVCSDGDVDGILKTKSSSSMPPWFVMVFSVFTEEDSIELEAFKPMTYYM